MKRKKSKYHKEPEHFSINKFVLEPVASQKKKNKVFIFQNLIPKMKLNQIMNELSKNWIFHVKNRLVIFIYTNF